ncbi:PASTA domain-containing protein [Cellulosimicrobium cellulans]|uniref:PASTA domain-containing protein n=1 Tax=Cellulosimicrobium cellulans TaxID=1710 RepID=UPI003019F45C
MRKTIVAVVGLVSFALAGCSGSPADPVTVTVAEEAEPQEDAPAPDDTEPEQSGEPETASSADQEVEQTFEMPSVVGQNLQDAQDLLQTLDSYVMDQVDATGLERFAVNDSNWTVCAQDPAPGAVVPISTVVTLSAVKLDEACP